VEQAGSADSLRNQPQRL